jgi:phosphatidylglycerophosphate synthase
MSTYQPTARRPIADAFRRTGRAASRFCAARGIHPDAVSYASIVAATLGAACFLASGRHPWLLVPAPAFLYLRLWLNMLDGMVALESGKASRRGEILNELPDRISDVIIFAGVAHSGLCRPESGYWAAILALFTAYVGTLGQAVGAKREFGGLMSKPWRMVALHLGAWATFAFHASGAEDRLGPLHVLDATCIVVVLGCLQTVAVRLARILDALKQQGPPRPAT